MGLKYQEMHETDLLALVGADALFLPGLRSWGKASCLGAHWTKESDGLWVSVVLHGNLTSADSGYVDDSSENVLLGFCVEVVSDRGKAVQSCDWWKSLAQKQSGQVTWPFRLGR